MPESFSIRHASKAVMSHEYFVGEKAPSVSAGEPCTEAWRNFGFSFSESVGVTSSFLNTLTGIYVLAKDLRLTFVR